MTGTVGKFLVTKRGRRLAYLLCPLIAVTTRSRPRYMGNGMRDMCGRPLQACPVRPSALDREHDWRLEIEACVIVKGAHPYKQHSAFRF